MRVEAVRALDEDLLHAVAVQRLDVRLRLQLVQVLVPEPARRLAVAGLLLAEDRERHLRLAQDPDDRARHLLLPVVERARAADEEEPLERLARPTRAARRGPRTTRSRLFEPMPQGFPCVSMPLKTRAASSGNADSTSTCWRRMSTRRGMFSMSTGQAVSHQPQVVHAQNGLRRHDVAVSGGSSAARGLARRRRPSRARAAVSVGRHVARGGAGSPGSPPCAMSGLPGDVGRAVRLAAAALGAAVDVPPLLPGEVLHGRACRSSRPRSRGRACAARRAGRQRARRRRSGAPVMMWKCFPYGRTFRKTRMIARWSQKPAAPIARGARRARAARAARARASPPARAREAGSPRASVQRAVEERGR